MFQKSIIPIKESSQTVSYPPNYPQKCFFSQFNNEYFNYLYQTPKKAEKEEDYDETSRSDVQYTAKETSSETKKSESCLSKDLLERLNEISPAKNLNEETQLPTENKKENSIMEQHIKGIAYLFEDFEYRDLKEMPIYKKKLNFGKPSSNNQSKCQKRKKAHHLHDTPGDWICFKCRNVNSSSSTSCYKCKMSKAETDKQNDLIFKKLSQFSLPKLGEFKLDINGP